MKTIIKYLKLEQKRDIIDLYKRGCSITTISFTVGEPQAVVQAFLIEQGYQISPKKYVYEVHGHLQMTGFDNLYVHQYVLNKYLEVEIEEIRKYIVHHVNQDKQDNRESNLWLFFDSAHHRQYHALLNAEEIGNSVEELYYLCLNQVDRDLRDLDVMEEEGFYIKGIAESVSDIEKIRHEYAEYVKRIKELLKKAKKNTFKNQSPQEV